MKIQSQLPKPQPARQPANKVKLDNDLPEDIGISADYIQARETTQQEPGDLKGIVYEHTQKGEFNVLKLSGQTQPFLPADIPASALNADNRVVIYVDGIHQELSEQKRQIRSFMQGQASTGADVDQSVIGIHEGAGKSGLHDGVRIGKALFMLKLVQNHLVPLEWASKQIYKIDPAIKSVHDEVKQSLLAGRKVQLITHSGGGAETATALQLLAREGMKDEIGENVRVLSMASAAAHKDFIRAGVKPDNLFYTGSKNDPVYSIFRHYLSPFNIISGVSFAIDAAKYGYQVLKGKDIPVVYHYHSPDYIFDRNMSEGSQRIQKFLNGGAGGKFPLP
ncbi:hypothetical protein JST97_21205 [bacterium]|nr:hypothetical protein [bacterium]